MLVVFDELEVELEVLADLLDVLVVLVLFRELVTMELVDSVVFVELVGVVTAVEEVEVMVLPPLLLPLSVTVTKTVTVLAGAHTVEVLVGMGCQLCQSFPWKTVAITVVVGTTYTDFVVYTDAVTQVV